MIIIFYVKEFYYKLKKRVRKDLRPGKNIYISNNEKVILVVQRHIRKNMEKRDKYYSYSGIYTDWNSERRLIKTRFNDYPWK